MGYAGPDAAGRTLRVGHADAVGVLLTERLSYAFSDPYAVEFLTGVSEIAEDHPVYAVAAARGIRLVATDPDPHPDSSWVAVDDRRAGFLVGRHLRDLGHHDVTVVVDTNRPPGAAVVLAAGTELGYIDTAERLAGLREAVPGEITLVSGGHNALASGVSAGRLLVESAELPTAIVGLSDVLALGVLEAVEANGLIAPADVNVCGFDDVAAAAAADLTTVRQPIRDRGRAVGRLLVDPAATPRQITLPIELVVRGTTGQARA